VVGYSAPLGVGWLLERSASCGVSVGEAIQVCHLNLGAEARFQLRRPSGFLDRHLIHAWTRKDIC
jgi:hypothetical protein